jgi:hypothetical protein
MKTETLAAREEEENDNVIPFVRPRKTKAQIKIARALASEQRREEWLIQNRRRKLNAKICAACGHTLGRHVGFCYAEKMIPKYPDPDDQRDCFCVGFVKLPGDSI